MLISIIVPVYNVESFLPQCIDSVLNQSYREIEVILVDDGSKDNSPQICDDYAGQDKRIKVIHKKNQGLVLARYDGALASTGDYITFVDGDDFILENRIQAFADGIAKYGHVDMICGSLSYYPNTDRKIGNAIEAGFYDSENMYKILPMFLSCSSFFNFGISPNLVSKCVKREFYCNHQTIPSNITLGEDLAVTYNLVLNAESIGIIENSDYMYRYNEASITHKYDEFLSKRIDILIEHLKSNTGTRCPNIEKQVEEYKCLLIKNVVLNDFLYYNEKYKIAKKKLHSDLKLLDYKNIIKKTKYSSLKDKIIYWLIKKDFFGLLYVLVKGKK